jgi:hypothetical protein
MTSDLTILCVTAGEPHAHAFVDRLADDANTCGADLRVERDGATVHSHGYVESVLDTAVDRCTTDYILRVDDDETISLGMLEWLRRHHYRQARHWAFPRRNLWPDAQHHVTNEPLWPDLQTRCSLRALAGGRHSVHDGSPYGTGRVAPPGVTLEHHKFLARTRADRERLVRHYNTIKPGAGTDWIMFSLPELYPDELHVEAAT